MKEKLTIIGRINERCGVTMNRLNVDYFPDDEIIIQLKNGHEFVLTASDSKLIIDPQHDFAEIENLGTNTKITVSSKIAISHKR